MTRQVTIFLRMMLIIGMLGLISCGDETPPAPATNVVKKKIVVPSAPTQNGSEASSPAGSTASTSLAAASPPAETQPVSALPTPAPVEQSPSVESQAPSPPVAQPMQQPVTEKPKVSGDGNTDLKQETAQASTAYNPQGRFDPFAPLFKEQAAAEAAVTPKEKRQKRVPQTPLENLALSQLKLSAVIRSSGGNRALVADASGKGYVIQTGTYIGLNAGKVILIEKDRIVIEEEIEDLLGEIKIQNSELKLQKPAGEF